jgi:hypothetical protein
MAFGRSGAGLQSLSVYRAFVIQRMRTLSRAQRGVWAIICWRSHSSRAGPDFGAKQGEFFAEHRRDDIAPDPHGDAIGGLYRVGTPQPAHEYRHTGPLHAAMVLPSPSGFSPSYLKLGTGMLARRYCRRSQQEIKC